MFIASHKSAKSAKTFPAGIYWVAYVCWSQSILVFGPVPEPLSTSRDQQWVGLWKLSFAASLYWKFALVSCRVKGTLLWFRGVHLLFGVSFALWTASAANLFGDTSLCTYWKVDSVINQRLCVQKYFSLNSLFQKKKKNWDVSFVLTETVPMLVKYALAFIVLENQHLGKSVMLDS